MTRRVLLVGQGMFGEGLRHLLGEVPNLGLVGVVNTWDEAQTLLQREAAEVIILDHSTVQVGEAELAALFRAHGQALQVISLTLTESKLTLFALKEVSNATLEDLVHLLRASGGDGRGEEA